MLKTVYRSICRDKHNCQRRDSNLDPLTPQSDALTTRLLRPAMEQKWKTETEQNADLLTLNFDLLTPNWSASSANVTPILGLSTLVVLELGVSERANSLLMAHQDSTGRPVP